MSQRPGGTRARKPGWPRAMLALSAVGLVATSCASAAHAARKDPTYLAVRIRPPAPATSVLAGFPRRAGR